LFLSINNFSVRLLSKFSELVFLIEKVMRKDFKRQMLLKKNLALH